MENKSDTLKTKLKECERIESRIWYTKNEIEKN